MTLAFLVRWTSGVARVGTRLAHMSEYSSKRRTGVEGVLKMNMNLLKSFFANEKGTETVEWGLMAGLIVGGLVLTVAAIGTWVREKFIQLNTDLRETT